MKRSMLPARIAMPESYLDMLGRRDRLDDALVLEFVPPGAWQVCDARVAARGAGRFLAFVEERDGRFEVMQLADKFVWSTFATMPSALTGPMRPFTPTSGKGAKWLEVVRLGKSDWRVSDSRFDRADGSRLLGYIEQFGRFHYELLWTTVPLRWAYVESFAAATAAFTDNTTFAMRRWPNGNTRPHLHGFPPRLGNVLAILADGSRAKASH